MENNIDLISEPLSVAYFSPLPPARSGVADYSAELLPKLSRHLDLTLFVNDPSQVDALIAGRYDPKPISSYPDRRDEFDVALYHIGNSSFHAEIYKMAIRFPGIVVLHDYVLHHFIGDQTVGRGNFAGYSRELAYALGKDGVQLAEAIRRGWSSPPSNDVPLNDRIADISLGTIVHSRFAADAFAEKDRKAYLIPALVTAFDGQSRHDELLLPDDAIIFGSFGQLTPNRQIPVLLEAFARLHEELPHTNLLLVGEAHLVDVEEMLHERNLEQSVHVVGFVPDLRGFIDWIHTADIVLNLRSPTMGETSATALRGMAASKPLIVNDHGWYTEIPADAAFKIPPDDPDLLHSSMKRLAEDDDLRHEMGKCARSYTDAHCAPECIAEDYAQVIREILQNLAGRS